MYHVNPTTGNVGVCKAGNPGDKASGGGCPFGATSDHHDTPDGARNAYETKMSGETLQVHKKVAKTPKDENSTPANKSLAKFNFDKAELRYQNAVMELNEKGSSSNLTPDDVAKLKAKRDIAAGQLASFSAANRQNSTSEKATQSVPAAPKNVAKARFEFDKADLEYRRTKAEYDDPNVSIPLSTDALYLAMQKRDQIAAKLGVPTLMSKIDADGAGKRAKRDKDLKMLKQLRSSVKSNEVGPGTDRERLYNVEKVFISAHTGQHPITGSHELRAPAKDVWEVAHSVAKYELENQSAKIEELKKFSFELNSKKREQRKNLISNGERMVAFYQGRLDEAEAALKDPNPDYPYDRKVSTSAIPAVARF